MPVGVVRLPPVPKKVIVKRGQVNASATIASKGVVLAEKTTGGPTQSVTFDRPTATVGVELGSSMSINYCSVTMKVYVAVPCYPEDTETTKHKVFAFVEEALVENTAWVKEALETLSTVKQQAEAKL
jgi:hypothetical protein